jgi:hypothetical protein
MHLCALHNGTMRFRVARYNWNDAALLLPCLCVRSVLVAVQISFAFVSSFFLLSGEGILSRFSCDLERVVSYLELWCFFAVLWKFS